MTEVNIPLLRKAVEWAEAEAAKPESESQWAQQTTASLADELETPRDCGTCYCIAGYVVSLERTITFGDWGSVLVDGDATTSICGLASESLGLPSGHDLFAYHNTIADVRRIAESIAGESL